MSVATAPVGRADAAGRILHALQDPAIALQKLSQEVKGQRGIWAKKSFLHAVQQAIELFAESEGSLVMDEPWGAFPGPQRAPYGFSDGGRIGRN
jgi:hypothetical protein